MSSLCPHAVLAVIENGQAIADHFTLPCSVVDDGRALVAQFTDPFEDPVP